MPSFSYQAQDDAGNRLSGTLDAPDAGSATVRLQALRLRVIEIGPLRPAPPQQRGGGGGGAPLRGEDFVAFNQQLAHLAEAGLPLESGLRLIAQDMRRGRLAATVRAVADDLERGVPLADAFARHGGRFPALYGRLVEAGVRAGNLPGVLLGLGRHGELVRKLRAMLWRTLTYPVVILLALAGVLAFIGAYVMPGFQELYEGFRLVQLPDNPWQPRRNPSAIPALTLFLWDVARLLPWIFAALSLLVLIVVLAWAAVRAMGREHSYVDRFVLRLPLVGRPLRASYIAQWCDALRLAVAAGMDLPQAIGLAGDVVRLPRLRADGHDLAARIESGLPLEPTSLRLLPATIPAAVQLSSGRNDLPETLRTLAEMYERQAETRIGAIPAVLSPLMTIAVAVSVGAVVLGLLLPLLRMLNSLLDPL